MTKLKEKIEVMQHFLNGGDVEYTLSGLQYPNWVVTKSPNWNWSSYEYRIKEKLKDKIVIEKWLIYSVFDGSYYTIESSNIDVWIEVSCKIKLLNTYEVEI